jgi:hypothetical protein
MKNILHTGSKHRNIFNENIRTRRTKTEIDNKGHQLYQFHQKMSNYISSSLNENNRECDCQGVAE